MLNGGAHHSLEVEAELRIRPLTNFQRLERPRGYHKMPLILFTDEGQPPAPNGPRLGVLALVPQFMERLVGRLVRFLTGGA